MFRCGSKSGVSEPVEETQPVPYELNRDPIDRADGVPLRLNPKERKAQRLMRGAILASNYTDLIDTEALATDKVKRNHAILKNVVSTLVGVLMATDMAEGIMLQEEKDFEKFKVFFPRVVEAYRRYKIMNPDLMRTDYVKFLYLVQDAVSPEVAELIGYSLATPVQTVKQFLTAMGIPEMLKDSRLPVCITPVPAIKDRNKLNKALRHKDLTVESMVRDWAAKGNQKKENVELAIRSLNDACCFANDNVDSTEELLTLFKKHFSPEAPSDRRVDLSINEGTGGSRLTHPHTTQYTFVLQSLTLWKHLSKEFFQLWIVAEEDMLDPANPYVFRRTGQGYQRVQPAPRLYRRISETLERTKKELGQWVGSEKIHLGDDQVPNAFQFIEKYAQISRIIIPILRTIKAIEGPISEDTDKVDYMKEVWGSPQKAVLAILVDFFRHGFDGSGGDNMEDAGSCIDGRLTSAWNWCNSIKEKPYYPLFLLAGFSSFDGDLTL
jgi:hypothetical protein